MPLTMPESFSDVLDFRYVLWKRKWTILLCTALVLVFTIYRLSREDPVFFTNARILISYQPPSALNVEDVFQRQPSYNPRQDTGMASLALLSSRLLAERVIDKLHLDLHSLMGSTERHNWYYYITVLIPEPVRKALRKLISRKSSQQEGMEPDSSPERMNLVKSYLRSLTVQPSETGMIGVTLMGTNPKELPKILQTHLNEFIKLDLELKFETSGEARDWIQEKLDEAKHRLEASELALVQYREDNNIISMSDGPHRGQQEGEYQSLRTTVIQYSELMRNRESSISNLRRILSNPELIESLPPMRDEAPILDTLKSDLVGKIAKYKNDSLLYGPEHPNMVRLKNEIQNTRNQIKQEVKKLLATLELQYSFYSNMRDKAEKEMGKIEKGMNKESELMVQYRALQSEAQSNREVYEQVLAKLNLVKLMGNMQDVDLMSTIKVIDKPEPAMIAPGSDKMRKTAKAGGMGFMLGAAVAFLLEFLDNILRSPKDLQLLINLPFLGFIPRLKDEMLKSEDREKRFVTIMEPASSHSETIRNVRTNLIFSFADRQNHAVLFTSPSPTEGKSTVVSQLAVSIAQLGKKTLLVDADLRRPSLHKLMRFENLSGVSDILIGEAKPEEVVHETGIKNLDFLSSGTIPPNPSELLASDALKELLLLMKSHYQVILFDTPPLIPVVDAKVLGPSMDGICVIVRSGQTRLPQLKQSIQQLQERNSRILGLILNHLDMEEYASRYGYSYDYYEPTTEQEEEVTQPASSPSS